VGGGCLAQILRRYSDQQVFEFVAAHERFVRRVANGVRLMMKFADLRNITLQRRDLSEADLTGSDFSNAKLAMGRFQRTSFYCASLEGADLRGADLTQADLRGVKLRGANLYGAMLDDADFRDAVLARADPERGYTMWRSDRGAASQPSPEGDTIVGVDFRDCSLRRARLGGARLQGADFSGANLDRANLAGARLDNAKFAGAIMTGVDLKGVRLSEGALNDCVRDPTPEAVARGDSLRTALDQAERWLKTRGVEGAPADLSNQDLRPIKSDLRGRSLPGMVAAGACGIEADFSDSQLAAATFAGADLRFANFQRADLRGVNFAGCRLTHADFSNADLGPLILAGGREHASNFEGSVTTGANFCDAQNVPLEALAAPVHQTLPPVAHPTDVEGDRRKAPLCTDVNV